MHGDLSQEQVDGIDALFLQSGENEARDYSWERFNDAQLRVGAMLSKSQVRSQYPMLLSVAQDRGLSNIEYFEEQVCEFEKEAEGDFREIYLSLLTELQQDFVQKRLMRRVQNHFAGRLWFYGIIALSLPFLVQAIFFLWMLARLELFQNYEAIPIQRDFFAFAFAASAGAFGAYFSRMISFKSDFSRFTFDEIQNIYVGRMLRLRMLYGAIGAVLLYVFIISDFLSSIFFPIITPSTIESSVGNYEIFYILSTPKEVARLMIWSTVAGFSERIIPDALTRIGQNLS